MDSVYVDSMMEVLGAEKFSGDKPPGSSWSPNQYKYLIFLPNDVISQDHFGVYERVGGSNAGISVKDFAALLEVRRLSTLEGIFIHPSLGGIALAEAFASVLKVGTDRIHTIGESSEKAEITTSRELPGSDGWQTRFSLQPEHYELDAEGGRLSTLFKKVQAKYNDPIASLGEDDTVDIDVPEDLLEDDTDDVAPEDQEEGTVDEVETDEDCTEEDAADEVEPDEESGDDLRKDVEAYYRGAVRGTINKILREYGMIFSSGYEVIAPAGVLMESSQGRGVLGRLQGHTLTKDRPERNLQFLYSRLKRELGLTEVPIRSVREIAQVLVTGKDSKGTAYSGTLVFPYKMMEYAFGQRRVSSDQESLSTYQGHAKANSWDVYSKEEVTPSLMDAILESIWAVLKAKGLETDPSSLEANKEATDIMEKFETAFCTCVLVSVFDSKDDGELIQLKVRVLDPTGKLPRNHNLLEDIIDEAYGDVRGSESFRSYDVRKNEGAYVEYAVELDTKLANAEPLFAYKALDKIKERGESLTFENAIFGKDTNDKILRNGGQINLSDRLAHLVVAGSRAGKGVWTFSGLAANVLSRRPIFYLDNKPDMASLFRNYGPNCFVVNGANITVDPENGTDFFRQFANEDSKIRPERVPNYVRTLFGGMGYAQLGDFVYAKGLMMAMGILAARVEVPNELENLGGKDGVLIVVDELANANSGLMAKFGVMGRSIAGTGYYAELVAGVEEHKIKAAKPTEAGYWFTHFYKGLEQSLIKLQMLSNAGLKNIESKRSDVFVLTQEPPSMVRSVSEVGEMFKSPYKTTNGVNGIDDYRILPSLAIVGGADVFIGYDKDGRRFLNQGDKSSPAYNYLNGIARNFGYLSNYTQETIDQFNTSKLAEKAIYYKPFLLFADGGQDEYFVQNALSYAKDVGANQDDIIARNRDDSGDPTRINSAVGFMSYLERAGIAHGEVTNVLNQSGNIAQFITDRMGYPGTWQELLMDFRPEWQFTVDDVINAAKGIPLSDTISKRMADFITVYPEAFPEGYRSAIGDTEDDEDDYDNAYETPIDLSGIDDDYLEEEENYPEVVPVAPVPPVAPVGTPTTPVATAGIPIPPVVAPGVVAYEDSLGAEELYDPYLGTAANTSEQKKPTLQFETSPGEFQHKRPTYIPSNHFGDTEDLEEHPLSVDWSDPESAQSALDYLQDQEDQALIDSSWGNRSYGNGNYYAPDGTPDNYDSVSGRSNVHMPTPMVVGEPKSLGQLMHEVTVGAVRVAGGPGNLTSIRVIDGMLIMNNIAYRPRFTREYLASLPVDLRNEVLHGKLARLFNWDALRTSGGRVTRLSFDNEDFVYDYVSPDLGWGSRISVDLFFKGFGSLQALTIGGTVFTRRTYRSQLVQDDTFYQPRMTRKVLDSADNALSKGTASSWNYTRTTFSRSDITAGKKVLGVLGGLTATAVVGTGAVTAKGTKVLGDGVRKGWDAFKGMMNNNRGY